MTSVGFSSALSHIKRDGIATWKFKHGTDTGHYSFGKLRDGKVIISPLAEMTSYQQQKQHGIKIEASAKVMNTHKSTVIELLPVLGTLTTNQIIASQNGTHFYSGDLGFHWRFVCEGGFEKQRYIEIFADGMMWIDHATYADLAALLASNPTPGTPAGGDVFYTWNATDPTGYVGAAAKTAQISLNGTLEDVGSIRKFRLIVEGQATQDDYGISSVNTIHVTVEFEMRQTSVELALMSSSILADDIGYSITLADGAVLALTTQLGFQFEHGLLTDAKDIGFIKVTASGVILPAVFATFWT